jgi:hypothetical protein
MGQCILRTKLILEPQTPTLISHLDFVTRLSPFLCFAFFKEAPYSFFSKGYLG